MTDTSFQYLKARRLLDSQSTLRKIPKVSHNYRKYVYLNEQKSNRVTTYA